MVRYINKGRKEGGGRRRVLNNRSNISAEEFATEGGECVGFLVLIHHTATVGPSLLRIPSPSFLLATRLRGVHSQ